MDKLDNCPSIISNKIIDYLSSYLAIIRNYKINHIIGMSNNLNKLKELLSEKIGTDLQTKKNLVENECYIPDLNCVEIYDLTSNESKFLHDPLTSRGCALIIIKSSSDEVIDLHKIFYELGQCTYYVQYSSDENKENF